MDGYPHDDRCRNCGKWIAPNKASWNIVARLCSVEAAGSAREGKGQISVVAALATVVLARVTLPQAAEH